MADELSTINTGSTYSPAALLHIFPKSVSEMQCKWQVVVGMTTRYDIADCLDPF